MAAAWARVVDGEGGRRPEALHQDILQSCNMEQILSESVRLDPEIAFRGSSCSLAEKVSPFTAASKGAGVSGASSARM